MVIVSGRFDVEPEDRDAFLASRVEGMLRSRAEQGCITYVLSADPIEPRLVVLYERWATRADLDAHLVGLRSAPPADGPQVAATRVELLVHDVSGTEPLGV